MIYQSLIRLLSPLIIAAILFDAKQRKGGWQFVRERLGLGFGADLAADSAETARPIWVHCASVGEVKAVEQLLKTSFASHNQAWLLTTSTPTGMQIAKQLDLPAELRYLPFDWPFAIKSFIKKFNPAQLLVVETELWPNLYQICASQNISVKIINGRISEKTLQAPAWLKKEYQACLAACSQVLAKSAAEKQRFVALGAKEEKVLVAGNLKFSNLEVAENLPRKLAQDYVVLASSHADEEVEIAKIWQALPIENKQELSLVIVPRHAKRAGKILEQLAQNKIEAQIYQDANQGANIIVVDKFGVLSAWLAHAKLVIMGGSFVPKGGHNFLEAAAFERAIISGADYRDFAEEFAALSQANGIILAQDYQQLDKVLPDILLNQNQLNQLGFNAKQVLQNYKKVLQDYLQLLQLD